MYGEFKKVFLHKIAAEKFRTAARLLEHEAPGMKFLILDALRPRAVQHVLWNHLEGKDRASYVADPVRGSNHNFGFAVDLTLLGPHYRELDMGTSFDSFQELAQPQREEHFLSEGRLTSDHVAHRRLLRKVMEGAGFIQLPHEWWHYDAVPREVVRARFPIVE